MEWFGDLTEKGVIFAFDGVKEAEPAIPVAISLILCADCRSLFAGILASSKETHETICGGSGAMEKSGGSCSGTVDERIEQMTGVDR